jgi:hypothetical protein
VPADGFRSSVARATNGIIGRVWHHPFSGMDPIGNQEKVFRECWQPMQERLGKQLTEFIRHFLMRDGQIVKQGDVYFSIKERVEEHAGDDITPYLSEIARFSNYYSCLLEPTRDPRTQIAHRIAQLNRFEATTAYPFLLNIYHDSATSKLCDGEFIEILDVVETFLIRRFVCGIATNSLSKIFVSLYSQAVASGSLVDGIKRVLGEKNFPRDQVFRERLIELPLYGGSDRREKAKLILDKLEASFEHKEPIDTTALTIEHVMPQTLTDWWKVHLGDDWASTHELLVHSIGNLTLTGYNPDMSNSDFPKKQAVLAKSHVELNRYFSKLDVWDGNAITKRGQMLADLATRLWPDFAPRENEVELDEDDRDEVTEYLDDVLSDLGGSVAQLGLGRFKIYRLPDGRIVNLKYSRSHGKYYWFGLHASLWEEIYRAGTTHMVLILGQTGYASVPLDVMAKYVADAGTSPKPDGSVRHYHLLVSSSALPELYHYGKPTRISIEPYLTRNPKPQVGAVSSERDVLGNQIES